MHFDDFLFERRGFRGPNFLIAKTKKSAKFMCDEFNRF